MIADKLLIGSGALATTQVVASLPSDGLPIVEAVKVIIQLIVGVATLISLFKKKNDSNNGGNPPLTTS